MSAPVRSDWHRLGAGLSVRFECADERMSVEWAPRTPTKREWRRIEDRYRQVRDAFLIDWGRRLGRPVLCLEVGA
jgi:hypothetical protein